MQPYERHGMAHVRLAGQDVERGTFNQRHAKLFDNKTGTPYTPLNNIAQLTGRSAQARYDVCNSNLSEAAALGFEYGYSLHNENALVIWEAQFGDFANGAQVIIDNFIASGTAKWNTASNLVLMLPHGFDGNGPEHSSARPERFLQMVDDDADELPGLSQEVHEVLVDSFMKEAVLEAAFEGDQVVTSGTFRKLMQRFTPVHMAGERSSPASRQVIERMLRDTLGEGWEHQPVVLEAWLHFMTIFLMRSREASFSMNVCNVTTPANMFHLLRRQVHRSYSTPLVIMSPKGLHHHTPCVSPIEHFQMGTHFQRVIGDHTPGDNMVKDDDDHTVPLGGSIVPFDTVNQYDENYPDKPEVRRLLICSGKVFYDLYRARKAAGREDVAIARVEQIFPFPYHALMRELQRYPEAEVVWVQEEPKNMGAWSYIEPRFRTLWRRLLPDQARDRIGYVGRPAAAAPGGGSFTIHQQEIKSILQRAYQPDPIVPDAYPVYTPNPGSLIFPKHPVKRKRPVRVVFDARKDTTKGGT